MLLFQENGDITPENGSHRGVQYPFSVNEKVVIKVHYSLSACDHFHLPCKYLIEDTMQGNKRTPDKFVGREAVITSQCLNGWYITSPIHEIVWFLFRSLNIKCCWLFVWIWWRYLLKILETGENVRLQYRSLRKIASLYDSEDRFVLQPVQNSSS